VWNVWVGWLEGLVLCYHAGTWCAIRSTNPFRTAKSTQLATHPLPTQDIGLFGLYAVVPPEKLQDFSQVLMQNLVRMAHDVTPEEVEKAKTQLKVRPSGVFGVG
jgi:hypothetical protein